MRVKISFSKDNSASSSIPLHHQKLLSATLHELASSFSLEPVPFSFSSLKGTSRIQNGFMRFLSTKVTMVLSSSDEVFINKLIEEMFSRPYITVGKMNLVPKNKEVIDDPAFMQRMRYLCISPVILSDPAKDSEKAQELVDPVSHKYSDALYNSTLDRMEQAGFTEAQLNSYAEFEIRPDREYMEKITDSGKKYARFYKSNAGNTMMGYLLPFTLHAHVDVHKFIWQNGLGVLTDEGYGMLDIVR